MTSENAIVGLAQGLLLVLLGQEQCRPGVLVVCQPDPENVVLVWKVRFTRSVSELASARETPAGH